MAIPDISAPPIPPQVMAQQQAPQSPASQYMAGAGATPQFDPNALMASLLNQVAENLGKVAKVLEIVRPELTPLVGKMAQMGSVLMQETQQNTAQGVPGGNPNQSPTQLQMPEAENASGALSQG